MSEFPYTDEQVHRFATRDPEWIGEDEGYTGYARRFLENLHSAGITVQFPKPRFFVEAHDHRFPRFAVVDRTSGAGRRGAEFFGPGSETYAREHADRLNREVQP